VSIFFLFLSSCNIVRAYIYIYKYLFVPCLHSRMIFCVFPGKICFLNNRICTMFIYYLFVCRVVHQFFLFFSFVPVFIYQSHRQNDDNDEKLLTHFDVCVCVCMSVFQFNTIMDFSHFCKKKFFF
jgi:hypothetical protein